MSEIDLARKIFNTSMFAANGGTRSRYQTGSYSNNNNGTFGNSSTRKGTVVAVDGNVVEVRKDGSSTTVKGTCETPVVVGQRVSVIFDGRTYIFIALSEFVQQTQNKFQEVQDEVQKTKDEILADVADDIETVNQSVADAVGKADEAASKADQAAQKADEASQGMSEITSTVDGLETKVDGFSTQITGAVDTANSALSAASSAQQDLNGFKTTVSQTYSTKTELDDAIEQEVLDRNTAITQSADSIKSEVSETYQVKGDYATGTELDQAIATEVTNRNSAITQSANSIKSEVSQTYQVKGDYATTDDLSDAIAQEVLDRNSAIEQSASEITATVSQNYQTKTDAGTMKQDLQTQITQNANAISTEVTNRTQAVSNAVSESKSYTDQKADSITQTVETNVMDTVGKTYATKTELEQAEASITSSVEESVMDEVGQTYATKTEVTQTANDWSVKLTAVDKKADAAQSTADTAKSTADTAKSTADSAQSAASTAQSTADTANSNATTAKTNAQTALDKATSASTAASNAAKTATDFLTYNSTGLTVGHSGLNQNLLLAPTCVKMTQNNIPMTQIQPEKIYLGNPSYGVGVISDSSLKLYDSAWDSYSTYEDWEKNSDPIVTLGSNLLELGGTAMVGGSYVGLRVQTAEGDTVKYTNGNGHDFYVGTTDVLSVGSSATQINGTLNVTGSSPRLKVGNGYHVLGCITRECTGDVTLTGTNAVIPFATTVEEFDPDSLLYGSTNYIRVTKPSYVSYLYVEVSFAATVNGLAAGQNTSLQLYKGTSTVATSASVVREMLTTPGGLFAEISMPPYLVKCSSTYTYFFIKGKCTGGGGTIQGGADYNPYWTVRIVGAGS